MSISAMHKYKKIIWSRCDNIITVLFTLYFWVQLTCDKWEVVNEFKITLRHYDNLLTAPLTHLIWPNLGNFDFYSYKIIE